MIGPPIIKTFGYIDTGVVSTDVQTFDKEITGLIFVYNGSPDIEGIIFIDEDSNYKRIG